MLGDVMQDLEAPYRPNISSYDSTADEKAYKADKASKVDVVVDESWKAAPSGKKYAEIHPSAATPAFKSLAIFTGTSLRLCCALPSHPDDPLCTRRRGGALRLPPRRLASARDVVGRIPPDRRMDSA